MSITKKTLVFAGIFCILLCLPVARALANNSQPIWQSAKMEPSAFVCDKGDEQGTDIEPLVTLGDGDTILLDNSDQAMGTLRMNAADGTLLLLTSEVKDGTPAKVLYGSADDADEQWLRRSAGSNGAPVQLLRVSVAYGDGYASILIGWVDISSVLNFTEIAENRTNAPLLEQIKTLQDKLELAAQTPTPTPLPTTTPQNDKERPEVWNVLRDPLIVLAVSVAVLIVSICTFIRVHRHRKDDLSWADHETDRRKHDIKECLSEDGIPAVVTTAGITGKAVEEIKRGQQEEIATLRRIEKKLDEKRTDEKDWEELAAIARSAMKETSFESWKNAFRSRNWLPLGIQPTTLNIPGEFEIAEFDMSQSSALFAPHDPAEKGRYYLIPSIEDRDLRSSSVLDLFELHEGELSAYEPYRVVKPAVLQTQNDRFFKFLFKGEIRIPPRSRG